MSALTCEQDHNNSTLFLTFFLLHTAIKEGHTVHMVKSATNRANEQAVQTVRPDSKTANARGPGAGGMEGFGDESVCYFFSILFLPRNLLGGIGAGRAEVCVSLVHTQHPTWRPTQKNKSIVEL